MQRIRTFFFIQLLISRFLRRILLLVEYRFGLTVVAPESLLLAERLEDVGCCGRLVQPQLIPDVGVAEVGLTLNHFSLIG